MARHAIIPTCMMLALAALAGASIMDAHAELSTDKQSYVTGETVILAGTLDDIEEETNVSIVLRDPGGSFVEIRPITISPGQEISEKFVAKGVTWSAAGTYTMDITYNGKTVKIEFEFAKTAPKKPEEVKPEIEPKETPEPEPKAKPEQAEPEPKKEPAQNIKPPEIPAESLPDTPAESDTKTRIPGFPSPIRAPIYYTERYEAESEYRAWFDSAFPGETIESVTGYEATTLPGFPSPEKSPHHYIDRFDAEPEYRAWFYSAFPNTSIYEILGYSDPRPIPDWARQEAQDWPGDGFERGAGFIIRNNILLQPDTAVNDSSGYEIPLWIGQIAKWWSDKSITDKEYIAILRHLLETGIIRI